MINTLKARLCIRGQPIITGDKYEGSYTITPKSWEKQTMKTKLKVMSDDVTIKEIPYYETSNKSGLTAIIGG